MAWDPAGAADGESDPGPVRRAESASKRFAAVIETVGPGPFRAQLEVFQRDLDALVGIVRTLVEVARRSDEALASLDPMRVTADLKAARRYLLGPTPPTVPQLETLAILERNYAVVHRVWDKRDHDLHVVELASARIEEVAAHGTLMVIDPGRRHQEAVLDNLDRVNAEIEHLRSAFEELDQIDAAGPAAPPLADTRVVDHSRAAGGVGR